MALLNVKHRGENELFETIVNSRPEDRGVRIEALNDLVSRHHFQDQTASFHGVLAAAKKFGISMPEGPMLSELLGRAMGNQNVFLELFLSFFANESKNMYFVPFAARFIKNLQTTQKSKAIPLLVNVLLEQDSVNTSADSITDTLSTFEDEKLNAQVASEILPSVRSANAVQVFLASRVLSRIAGESASEGMQTVLERTLAEWYGPLNSPGQLNDQIQDQVILFLTRTPSEKALPIIRKTILVRRTGILTGMFHGFQLRSAAELLEEIIEQYAGDPYKFEISNWGVMSLAQLETRFIDLRKLVSIDALLRQHWQSKYYIKQMFLAAKEDVKPILFELLKNSNPDKYAFAAECLSELGVSVDEMSRVVGESAPSELYRYFYPKENAEEIWKKKVAKELGGSIGKPTKRFDLFLIQILSSLNFQVLYVDSAEKPGIDFVALSPTGNHMIIAGATIESLKDDLGKLSVTLQEMREKMKELMERHEVIPVVFSASRRPVTEEEGRYARQSGIVVLGRSDVEQVLKMSRTGRGSHDLVTLLKEKLKALSSLPTANPFN